MRKILFILVLLGSRLEAQVPARSIWKSNVQPFTCNSIQLGAIYENTTDGKFYICDGVSTWKKVVVEGAYSFPASVTTVTNFFDIEITTPSTTASDQLRGFSIRLIKGAASVTGIPAAVIAINEVPYANTASLHGGASIAFRGVNNTTGTFQIGTYGQSNGAAAIGAGVEGLCQAATDCYGTMGIASGGTNRVGVYGGLNTSSSVPTGISGAGIFDNESVAAPILRARDNGIDKFVIANEGDIQIDRTITAGGTTGAQTINKNAGTVNFAAAATTLVVTNSIVTTSSIIFLNRRTNDVTCFIASAEPGAGSFTIRMTAACTAETSVGFLVTN